LGWALPEDIGEVVGFFPTRIKEKRKKKKRKRNKNIIKPRSHFLSKTHCL
jgi:hypothetical protein